MDVKKKLKGGIDANNICFCMPVHSQTGGIPLEDLGKFET